MTTTRLVINLVSFLAISLVVVAWAASTLFGTTAVPTMQVTAVFAGSAGMQPGTDVSYLGQSVGRVDDVTLTDDAVEVEFSLTTDEELPAAVTATIRRRSAIGEPYLDLEPIEEALPSEPLADGDVIPLERTQVPLKYSRLFEATSELFQAIDPDDLEVLLTEISTALEGRGPAIQQILREGGAVAETLGDGTDVIEVAVTEVGELTDLLARQADEIDANIDDVRAISDSIASLSDEYTRLVTQDDAFLSQVTELVAATRGDLGCTLVSLSEVAQALDPATIEGLERVLEISPRVREIVRGTQSHKPDGTWLETELLFTDEQIPLTPPSDELPPVPEIGECGPAAPLTGTADDASTAVGRQGPPAAASGPGAGPVGRADTGTEEGAAGTSTRADVVPAPPPIVPALVGLGILALVAVTRPWRLLGRLRGGR